MKLQHHIAFSVPLGIGFYFFNKNLLAALLAMMASVAIDIDHVLEYFLAQRRLDPVKKMIKAFESTKKIPKNYLFFHSWELIFLLGSGAFLWPHPYAVALFAGFSVHLLADQIYNTRFLGRHNRKALFYFFGYRAGHHFNAVQLSQEEQTPFKE